MLQRMRDVPTTGIETLATVTFRRFGSIYDVTLGTLNKDVRYSLRVLSQRPGFTITAILVLALGIGANTAMFTVIDATLLRPLPYAAPDRLVNLYERDVIDNHNQFNAVSPPNFRDWQRQSASYDRMAAFRVRALNLSGRSGMPRNGSKSLCVHLQSVLHIGRAARARKTVC